MKKLMMLLFVCVMGVGCSTQVDLCDFPEHPHRYELHVTYDWGTQEHTPDSMYIIGNRLFNTIRYWFNFDLVNQEGRLLQYLPNKREEEQVEPDPEPTPEPDPEPTPEPDPEPDTDTPEGEDADPAPAAARGEGDDETGGDETDPEVTPEGEDTPGEDPSEEEDKVPTVSDFSLRAGIYQMLTINNHEQVLLDSIDKYMSSTQVPSSILKLTYKKYAKAYMYGDTVAHWVDFNKGYPYIDNVGAVYYDLVKLDTEGAEGMHVTFHPTPITQQVNFHLNVQLKGKEVTVDSIRGEVSGVCSKLELFSKYLDMDATQSCRVMFDAQVDPMASDSLVAVHSTVHVPSLLNSADPDMKTGPGMLYLAVYVHAVDDNGKVVRKTCYAGANLYPYLIEKPLTKLTDKVHFHHVITEPVVDIQIDKILPISRNEILDVKDPDQNIDYWFKEEGDQGGSDIEF